ncbi:acyl-CoA thioesterase [Zhongshania borealis]|uniref:Acyl-CoA thioesterase n=1 Tax=Zhongshania borealis TaxID=889488 RepID=A0ABP7W7J1_9GAMM
MRNKQFTAGIDECDERGRVKNAVINDWFEEAAKAYLDECFFEFPNVNQTPMWQQQSLQFDYLNACLANSCVELELSVTELAKRSCTLGCRFYQAGRLLAVGSCVMVFLVDGVVAAMPTISPDALKSEMLGFLRIDRR